MCPQLNTDWTQVEVITLVNDGTGLGFGIIGGKSTGVVVKTILPGGVADRVTNYLLESGWIGYWHRKVVCLSVCGAVHCG